MASTSQSEVLQILHEKAPFHSKILEIYLFAKKFPNRLVQKLVDKKLIYKSISKDDNRKTVLHLTKQGRELIPQLLEIEKTFNDSISKKFDNPTHVDELTTTLYTFLSSTEGIAKLKRRLNL